MLYILYLGLILSFTVAYRLVIAEQRRENVKRVYRVKKIRPLPPPKKNTTLDRGGARNGRC